MSSSIKPKRGCCPTCDNGKEIYTLGGFCKDHYWENNAKKKKEKAKAKGTDADKKKKLKELNVFFASQLIQVPDECENCGESLAYLKRSSMKKAIIAHILPKREKYGFPEVATHPQNRLFLCGDCHTNFDNKGEDFAVNMKAFPLILERFKEFKHLISEANKQRLPSYLKNI